MIGKIKEIQIEFLKNHLINLENELNKSSIDKPQRGTNSFAKKTLDEISKLNTQVTELEAKVKAAEAQLSTAATAKGQAQGAFSAATANLSNQKAIKNLAAIDRDAVALGIVSSSSSSSSSKVIQKALKQAAEAVYVGARTLLANFKTIAVTAEDKFKKANEAWAVINTKLTTLQLNTSNKFEDLIRKKGELIYKDHQKSRSIIEKLKVEINKMITEARRGGKKTRQNKQKYQKKYTKRQKKVYRKRSQKHFKVKRHKNTKKRNRK